MEISVVGKGEAEPIALSAVGAAGRWAERLRRQMGRGCSKSCDFGERKNETIVERKGGPCSRKARIEYISYLWSRQCLFHPVDGDGCCRSFYFAVVFLATRRSHILTLSLSVIIAIIMYHDLLLLRATINGPSPSPSKSSNNFLERRNSMILLPCRWHGMVLSRNF